MHVCSFTSSITEITNSLAFLSCCFHAALYMKLENTIEKAWSIYRSIPSCYLHSCQMYFYPSIGIFKVGMAEKSKINENWVVYFFLPCKCCTEETSVSVLEVQNKSCPVPMGYLKISACPKQFFPIAICFLQTNKFHNNLQPIPKASRLIYLL